MMKSTGLTAVIATLVLAAVLGAHAAQPQIAMEKGKMTFKSGAVCAAVWAAGRAIPALLAAGSLGTSL